MTVLGIGHAGGDARGDAWFARLARHLEASDDETDRELAEQLLVPTAELPRPLAKLTGFKIRREVAMGIRRQLGELERELRRDARASRARMDELRSHPLIERRAALRQFAAAKRQAELLELMAAAVRAEMDEAARQMTSADAVLRSTREHLADSLRGWGIYEIF